MDKRIKRNILMMATALACLCCFAEDYRMEKILEVNQEKEKTIHLRMEEEVEPYDDMTGNVLMISDEGEIYDFCFDSYSQYKMDENTRKFNLVRKADFLESGGAEWISEIKDKYILCTGTWGRCKKLDRNYNLVFRVNFFDLDMRVYVKDMYYDEETDIIFYQMYDQTITCLIHPTMDMQENKRNYHNAAETKALLEGGTYAPHLSLYEDQYLVIDGKITPFGLEWHGNYRYQVFGDYEVCLWNGKLDSLEFEKKEGEIVESTAIHPSGDVYRLVYNKKTKLHTLYRIQNTWDSSYRREWYKAHKGAF